MTLRAPLTPPDCDLRDFPRMMIDIPRLFASEFNASVDDTQWRFGMTLWLKSFHQVPAASLPDDDVQLARLVEIGRDVKTWQKAKAGCMRKWVKCGDGRLYHPVVAEFALEAWIEKLLARLSSGAGNATRYGYHFDPAPLNAAIEESARLLHALNPRSKAADKLKRRQSRATPSGTAAPLPPGGRSHPTGSPGGVPSGSQETGTGTEKDLREEDSCQNVGLPLLTDPSAVAAREPEAAEVEFGRRPAEVVTLPAVGSDAIREAVELWNELAARLDLPRAVQINEGRRKGIRARLGEGGLDLWRQALAALEASSYCRGGGDRGWKADLDFVCQPKSFTRLIEGYYADRHPGAARRSRDWSGVDMAIDAYRSGQ